MTNYTSKYTGAQIDQAIDIASTKFNGTLSKDIGGFKKGQVIENLTVDAIIQDLLFPYVSFTFNSISTQQPSTTYEYGTEITISKVTPNFTAGTKAISSIKVGTTSGGKDLYEGSTATSGTAITLTTPKAYDGVTGGTIYCELSDGTTTTPKSATVRYDYYPYAIASTDAALTAVTSGAIKANSTTLSTAISLSPDVNSYIWFLLPPGTTGNKTIQYEALGQWYEFDGGTAAPVDVTLKLNSGITVTYKGYRTNKMAAPGSTTFKIV